MSIMKRMVLGEKCDAIATCPPRAVPCDLHPGDVIRTCYGTGPYRIKYVTPDTTRTDVVHLTLELAEPDPRFIASKSFWINDVQRWEDGRYTSRNGGDELIVVSRATAQLALF